MKEVFRRHRYPTNFPVSIQSARGRHTANVIDVNEMGARLAGLKGAKKGDQLTLVANAQSFDGIVRWVGADRLGLTFRPMLTALQVDTLRKAVKPSRTQRWNPGGLQEMR